MHQDVVFSASFLFVHLYSHICKTTILTEPVQRDFTERHFNYMIVLPHNFNSLRHGLGSFESGYFKQDMNLRSWMVCEYLKVDGCSLKNTR